MLVLRSEVPPLEGGARQGRGASRQEAEEGGEGLHRGGLAGGLGEKVPSPRKGLDLTSNTPQLRRGETTNLPSMLLEYDREKVSGTGITVNYGSSQPRDSSWLRLQQRPKRCA